MATDVVSEIKVHAPPETPDSPFSPPYRSDTYFEDPLLQLQPYTIMKLEAEVHTLHQEALMHFVRRAHSCPEPVPHLISRNCTPSNSEEVRSERIHAVMQLLSQIREHHHQTLLRKVYKTFGSDHRKAAKDLYARELFTTAYIQYWSLYTCLSCDKCRRLSAPDRHNLTVDLLEKLAVTCLRAGWLVDAEKFAADALKHERCSTRARIWYATAQLGLGKLEAARRNLNMLPRRGNFPAEFPPWIESRVLAQREILVRLEMEAQGKYDIPELELDPPDRTPDTPHSTVLFHLEATPAGYRTTARIAKDTLLIVAPPLACVPCYTTEQPPSSTSPAAARPTSPSLSKSDSLLNDEDTALFSLALAADAIFEQAKTHAQSEVLIPKRPRTLHDDDPSLLSLAQICDTVYAKAKILSSVRAHVRAAAARCDKDSEGVIDLVGNDLRAAAIVVVQNYAMCIPHALRHGHDGGGGVDALSVTDRDTAGAGTGTVRSMDAKYGRPVHAGHALYLPALMLLSSISPNTYATYHGPYLFLRAGRDLVAGSILTFDGFPGRVTALRGSALSPPPRARVSALAPTSPTSKTSSRGLAIPSP